MHIAQLMEGQEREIANLHTRTILRLYTPLSVEEAARVPNHGLSSLPHHQGEPGVITRQGGIPVTHTLKNAAPYADVVIQFSDSATHLAVPEAFNTSKIHAKAHERYPESQMPVVSYLLLETDEPSVYYRGIIPSTAIDAYYLVSYDREGKPTPGYDIKGSLSHDQFGTWLVNKYQKRKKLARYDY